MGTKNRTKRIIHNVPNHRRKSALSIHVGKELRKTIKSRSIVARKGDTVKILRGDNAGKSGAILIVNPKYKVIYIEGITTTNSRTKKEVLVSVQPSNVILVSRGDAKVKKIAKKEKEEKKETKTEEAEKPKKEKLKAVA